MYEKLKELLPQLQRQVPLASLTTYRIGGAAEFFLEAKTADEIALAAAAARQSQLPCTLIGGGSNVLISDDGVKGLVIRLNNRDVQVSDETVRVGAGAAAGLVALKSVEAGLTGFEWAAGLPGTIGGAVRGNAGMYGGEMKDAVESVEIWADGERRTLDNAACEFGYRDSVFKRQPTWVILEVSLRLKPTTEPMAGKALMRRHLEDKRLKQPIEHYSAGCVFKNWRPESSEQLEALRQALDLNGDEVIPVTSQGTVPSGWIIDRAQLKGYRVGHAWVSEKHGNFLVHDGHANASEIIALIAAVKMKVRDMTKGIVNFEEEIQYVGF